MAIRLQTVNKSDAQVILWVRVSTDRQEIDSMKKDLIDLAKSDGFTESQMIVIGSVGASARKLDSKYLEDINTLIDHCENNTNIVAVYCWEVSRLARKLEKYTQVRATVKDNGIQLIVYKPYFRLFEESSGTINFGVDLALNLLALFAEQEMELKEARYKRGKQRNRENMKFNGGTNGTLFGYTVDKDGFIVIDEEESKVVKMIFEKYATGNYSTTTLANEMSDLGYGSRKSSRFNQVRISYILKDTSYLGYKTITFKVKDGSFAQHNLKYPRIISDALFNQCKEIRERNVKGGITKQTKHLTLASKILKCKECGSSYSLCNHAYRCVKTMNRYNKYKDNYCTVKASISADAMDTILWEVVKFYFICDRLSGGSSEQTRINAEKADLEQRLQVQVDELNQIQGKKDRLTDSYIDGNISKVKYQQKLEDLEAEESEIEIKIEGLKTKLAQPKFLNPIEVNYHLELSALDKAEKRQLCLTYIDKAYIQPVSGQKKTDVEIYAKDGGKFLFRYDYYKRKGQPYQLIFADAGSMLTGQQLVLRTYALEQAVETGFTAAELNDFMKMLKATIHKPTGNKFFDDMVGQYAENQVELTKEEIEFIEGSGLTLEEYNRWVEEQEEIADKAEDPID